MTIYYKNRDKYVKIELSKTVSPIVPAGSILVFTKSTLGRGSNEELKEYFGVNIKKYECKVYLISNNGYITNVSMKNITIVALNRILLKFKYVKEKFIMNYNVLDFPYMKYFLPAIENMINMLKKGGKIAYTQDYTFDGKSGPVVQSTVEDYYMSDALANYYTEEARIWCTRNNNKSPLAIWRQNSDIIKRKATKVPIMKGITRNTHLFQQRESLYGEAPSCNNFSIALGIYIIKSLGAKRVLDPSSGWGDRALASIITGVEVYRGYDPNIRLLPGYFAIESLAKKKGVDCKFNMLPFDMISDDSIEEMKGSFDLVLTSPPYFDLEKYGEGVGQSIVRYSTYKEWIKGFLYPYLDKAWSSLRKGGNFAIYIEDVREMKLTEEVKKWMNKKKSKYRGIIGFQYVNKENKVKKIERRSIRPTFVWQKE